MKPASVMGSLSLACPAGSSSERGRTTSCAAFTTPCITQRSPWTTTD